ncbi:clathrin interactor EPSIN 1-like isoform X2 [Andrographis paniculata]|uniref:clathrin interactor EPSIN 1-like isoform X2 n=1 Tax=Andrographis paniculata TaxID=175694 RepID=UPI0021E9409B|nr:clathrin interactor EPSIN 1-like isoform X2 [Andrographis paniculata]
MDLMKVFDQAVREIKREVNLKVLKVPEIEQKVLDATDDEPWGPHGTVLAEIAQATKKFSECRMVMNVLWTRLTETGKNWRLVYKALSVIEYLVAHGSERAVEDIGEHTYQISSLASFEYVEPSGKDLGINVRKKAETISALLNNQEKIQEVRNKAAINRDKYFGLSSSGITYGSGAASFSSNSFRSSDRYGGFCNTGDTDTFKSSYKDGNRYGEEKFERISKLTKEPSNYGSKEQGSATSGTSKTANSDAYSSTQGAPSNKYDEDFDDFDPRGTLTSKSSTGSNQVDLFGQNFVDFFDAPVSHAKDNSTSHKSGQPEVDLFAVSNNSTCVKKDQPEIDLFADANNSSLRKDQAEVDLFADSNFISATPELKVEESSVSSANVDLFAAQPTPALSSTMDFFAAANPVSMPDNKDSKSGTTSFTGDPFAAVPLNKFDGLDSFGACTSLRDPLSTLSSSSSPKNGSHGNANESSVETKTSPKKQTFQVNSGIWTLLLKIRELNTFSAPESLYDKGLYKFIA